MVLFVSLFSVVADDSHTIVIIYRVGRATPASQCEVSLSNIGQRHGNLISIVKNEFLFHDK